MEESQEGNWTTEEKSVTDILSSSLSGSVDGTDVGKAEAELQNLALGEGDGNSIERALAQREEKKRFNHPFRPEEPDCAYYIRTGTCRFGSNCKFNHPRRRRNQVVKDKAKEQVKNQEKEDNEEKEKEKAMDMEFEEGKENEKEAFHEKEGQQIECKYYLKAGGCKFGNACRYNHSKEKAGAEEVVDLNFLGLPLRPGEKECPFYMRTGSCKFATNCKFHHPDPAAIGRSDSLPAYSNGTSIQLHASTVPPPLPTLWPLQRASNETVPYIEAPPPPYLPPMLPPLHSIHPAPEWNRNMGLASQFFPSERQLQVSSPSNMSGQAMRTDNSSRPLQTTTEEFPQRPGQSECQYYMKFGDCKFKSACRYHHPKKSSTPTACALSPMGLPLRPDQSVCVHYSRYGICKFGPACKYDHPTESGPSAAVSDEAGVLTC